MYLLRESWRNPLLFLEIWSPNETKSEFTEKKISTKDYECLYKVQKVMKKKELNYKKNSSVCHIWHPLFWSYWDGVKMLTLCCWVILVIGNNRFLRRNSHFSKMIAIIYIPQSSAWKNKVFTLHHEFCTEDTIFFFHGFYRRSMLYKIETTSIFTTLPLQFPLTRFSTSYYPRQVNCAWEHCGRFFWN